MTKKYLGTNNSSQRNIGKIICQNKQCSSLGSYQTKDNFYCTHNPECPIYPICKKCIKEKVSLSDINSVYNTLKLLDIPFIFNIWEKCTNEDSENFFENYINILNSERYINSHWEDSVFPQKDDIVEETEHDVPLWDDEWQGNYTKGELEYLNHYLSKLREQFDITNINYVDYAKKIANASLIEIKARNVYQSVPTKENFAMWKDANAMFDNLSKSAKFSENTRTSNDVGLGSFGQIFDAVEKHNYVPKFIPEDKDMYDKLLEQFSNVEKSL